MNKIKLFYRISVQPLREVVPAKKKAIKKKKKALRKRGKLSFDGDALPPPPSPPCTCTSEGNRTPYWKANKAVGS